MPLLHTVAVAAGCVLARAPALLPTARPTKRWPHVVIALGMAASMAPLDHTAHNGNCKVTFR